MNIILGMTYGPKSVLHVLPLADVAYGPCAGGSFLCAGRGSAHIDPMSMVDMVRPFQEIIICAVCWSARESEALAIEVWGSEAA